MNLTIKRYDGTKHEARWDHFVLNDSVNGTFLQTRNFLNYHPAGRFKDASVLVENGSNIVAVIPACDVMDEGERCFFSHKGSTFGGIVLGRGGYNLSYMERIMDCLERHLAEEGYEKAILRGASALFSERDMSLMDYFLFKAGYDQFDELSFYVDCEGLSEDIASAMTSSRRRDLRYALRNPYEFRELNGDDEIARFYRLLERNLTKFGARPVHALEELLEFKHRRLSGVVGFYGAFLEGELIAGSMTFNFAGKVLHTQYLASDPDRQRLFPMNFLVYNLIKLARDEGYAKLSFGISTQERGRTLNTGLALFKEGFGSEYCVNRSHVKRFGRAPERER